MFFFDSLFIFFFDPVFIFFFDALFIFFDTYAQLEDKSLSGVPKTHPFHVSVSAILVFFGPWCKGLIQSRAGASSRLGKHRPTNLIA